MAGLLHWQSFMSLFRTVAPVIALLAGATVAGAAPISFLLEDAVAGTGIKVQNNGASIRFETQTVVMGDAVNPPDSDGDTIPDGLDVEPLDGGVAIDGTDLLFAHSGDAVFGASGVSALGQFGGNWMWMFILPTFPADLSTYANPFEAASRFDTNDDPFPVANLFFTGDPSPWLALGGVSGFLGGVFQTSDALAHQFWVELIVDVADGSLTLLSAGYDTDVYAAVDDPEPVPEPATWSMFVLGTAGLAVLHRRRRR